MTLFSIGRVFAVCAGALLFQGCAITDEFNRRGGFADHVLDKIYFPAHAPEHQVFRSYLLVGILARIASESPININDRGILALRVRDSLQAAKAALECAVDAVCAVKEDTLAILDRRLLRLALAVLNPEEARDMFAKIRDKLLGKIPIGGRAVSAASAAIKLVGEGAGAIEEGAKIVESLLELGTIGYEYSNRLGPIYRDTMLLDMQIFVISARNAAPADCGAPGSPPSTKCDVYLVASELAEKSPSDIQAIRRFLRGQADNPTIRIAPRRTHWMQASDIVWRACDLLSDSDDTRQLCRGRGNKPTDGYALIFYNDTEKMRKGRSNPNALDAITD